MFDDGPVGRMAGPRVEAGDAGELDGAGGAVRGGGGGFGVRRGAGSGGGHDFEVEPFRGEGTGVEGGGSEDDLEGVGGPAEAFGFTAGVGVVDDPWFGLGAEGFLDEVGGGFGGGAEFGFGGWGADGGRWEEGDGGAAESGGGGELDIPDGETGGELGLEFHEVARVAEGGGAVGWGGGFVAEGSEPNFEFGGGEFPEGGVGEEEVEGRLGGGVGDEAEGGGEDGGGGASVHGRDYGGAGGMVQD